MDLGEQRERFEQQTLDLSDGTRRPGGPEVEVRRSARRRRTISARWEGDRLVVMVPAGASARQEHEWVEQMRERLERKRRAPAHDRALADRARRLATRHDLPTPVSVRWVGNQHSRWGSCTPAHGTIRISDRLQHAPDYVLDYVVVHELAHLVVAAHDARFHVLVGRFPRVERAQGYLEGLSASGADRPQEC